MLNSETINFYGIDRLPFFQELPSGFGGELINYFQPIHLNSGDILMRKGSLTKDLYLIVNGRVNLIDESQHNKLIAELHRGDLIGESSFFSSRNTLSTAIAVRNTFLLKLTKADFEKIHELYPKETLQLIQNLLGPIFHEKREQFAEHTAFFLYFDHKNNAYHQMALNIQNELSRYGTCHLITAKEILMHRDHIDSWLANQHIQYRYILYEAYKDDFKFTKHCLHHTDRVLIFCQAENQELCPIAEKIYLDSQVLKKSTDLILIHKPSISMPSNSKKWLEQLPHATWHHIRENSIKDIQRIVRIITGHAISIVLGGGGAKTLVFIGFYKAHKELEIPIDWVGGTCAGAIITTGIAMNLSIDEMVDSVKVHAPKNTYGVFDFTLPIVSLSSGKSLSNYLISVFGKYMLEDLWINNFMVTTNLTKSQLEIIKNGPAWKALRASIGIPLFLHPVSNSEGDLLVDGALMNNLPVDIMKSFLKRGKVIAGRLKYNPLNSLDMPSHSLGFWSLIKAYFSGTFNFTQLNLFKMLDRTTMIASRNHANEISKLADFCIQFEPHGVGYFHFGAVDRLVDLGYRMAMEHAEELLELKKIPKNI